MNFVHKNYINRNIIESDENALLDISDFDTYEDNCSHQFIQFMGKSGKRKHSLDTNSNQYLNSSATDDDSGFCGSNLSTITANKMVRFDDEMLLLKALMKEVNEPIVTNNQQNNKINLKPQNSNSSKSKNGKYELKILSQPEEQHRARYLTEGSRGAIKDKSGLGHPIVKLCGYNKSSVKIECFIGHDKQLGTSHLFYQASKITGKNSTRCTSKKVDGTTVIVMDACPENDMQVTVDCVGILKERNVDVEQKLTRFKAKSEMNETVAIPTKKRSTRCRLVFRAHIPETNEVLQIVSSPILCTQPLGTPEISKKSLSECDVKGGIELFIIGKNFLKDSKVIWKTNDWTKVVEPDKEFLHPTHLVCIIPCYDGPNLETNNSIEVSLLIKSGGKYSDPHKFTFINVKRVDSMSLINGRAQFTSASAPDQFFVSNMDKSIILTMIGSTAPLTANSNPIDSLMVTQSSLQSNDTQISTNGLNELNSETLCYSRANSTPERVLPIIDEDTNMSSSLTINTTTAPNDSQITHTFNLTNGLIFDKTIQNIETNIMSDSIDTKMFKNEMPLVANSCEVNSQRVQPMIESVAQYLPLNSLNGIPSNDMTVNNSTQMTDISAVNSLNCDSLMQSMPSTQTSYISSDQSLSIVESLSSVSNVIDSKPNVSIESDALKSIISQNPVLTSTASTTPTTQANNISALSEMSDAELLCFINPATFDQI